MHIRFFAQGGAAGRLLLALAGIILGGVASVALASERVTVLTYNIHHAEGVDGKLDLERIAEVIRRESPDLVALQEVDQGTRRTGNIDQPAVLGRLTGMNVEFGKNIEHDGGNYGNAVLSKRPIKLRVNLALPSIHNQELSAPPEQRGALIVEATTSSGLPFYFVSTHLDHRRQHDERLASAQALNAWFQREAVDRAAILAGDLNATPQSPVLQEFRKHWQVAGAELATSPASAPVRQIDYVLYSPADRWRVLEVRVLDEPVASDHRPLVAVFEVTSSEGR